MRHAPWKAGMAIPIAFAAQWLTVPLHIICSTPLCSQGLVGQH